MPCTLGGSDAQRAVLAFAALQSFAGTGVNAILYNYFREVLAQNDSRATFYATVVNACITIFGVAGGVLADLAWGKLKVQAATSWVWMAGVALLLLAVATPSEHYGGGGDDSSSTGPSPSLGVLLLSAGGLLLLAVGYGAQQPSQSAFIGEQATVTGNTHRNHVGALAVQDANQPLLPPPAPPRPAAEPAARASAPAPGASCSGSVNVNEGLPLLGQAEHGSTETSSTNSTTAASLAARIASFYSWFYFWENAGAVLGETVCPLLRQHVSFTSLFLCVLACQVLGIWALLSTRRAYNSVPPEHAVVFVSHQRDTAQCDTPPFIPRPGPAGAFHCCSSQYCVGFPRLCVVLCGAADTEHSASGHWQQLRASHNPLSGAVPLSASASPGKTSSGTVSAGGTVVLGPHESPVPCCPCTRRTAGGGDTVGAAQPGTQYSANDWASLRRVGALFVPITVFWALYFQQNNYWVTQAQDTDTTLVWHTPDALGSVNDVMVCILVPLFATYVYPAFERCGVRCSPLRRIGVGIAAAAGAFVAAALLQLAIGAAAPQKLSVAWQLPQYLLISISETCIAVTGLEFAYTQVTVGTRGAVQAMWTLTQLGQLLTGVVALVQVGTLADKFFFFAGAMGVFGLVFVALAVRYKYATPADLT